MKQTHWKFWDRWFQVVVQCLESSTDLPKLIGSVRKEALSQ